LLVNWGSSEINRPIPEGALVLNKPESIAFAANKLNTFNKLAQDERTQNNLPRFTTDKAVAASWEKDVYVRHVLTGHSGRGIQIVEAGGELPDAPLYTGYIKRQDEYRVHVAGGEVIFVQRKARKLDVPDDQVNWKVRNLEGGFIYANEGVEISEDVKQLCINAIEILGLDFGAVDLVNTRKGKFFILEVNTAPGLGGTTLEKYAEYFTKVCNNLQT